MPDTLPLICYNILKMASTEVKWITSLSQTRILKSFRVGLNLFPGPSVVVYFHAFFTKPNINNIYNNSNSSSHQNSFKKSKDKYSSAEEKI